MAKTVRTADLSGNAAANLFAILNPGEVEYLPMHPFNFKSLPPVGVIITDTDPDELNYPEGWYFAKGTFRNKHNSSTGIYEEVPMLKSNGSAW